MSVITNKWNDGSGDSINIESPSFQGNQTVKISSPVQKGTSKRSIKFIGKCKKDFSKQVILTVEQEASTYTYDLTLNSDNTEIAAKGGTATITAVLKTYRNGNLVSTDNVTPVLSGSATGFSISGTTVTASNRTTTTGNKRAIVVTGKYSNTFDGQTVSSTITIYQEANMASYGALEGGSLSASDIPAMVEHLRPILLICRRQLVIHLVRLVLVQSSTQKQMKLQFLLLEPQLRQELRLDKLL